MILATHVSFCAYGFWLPNDPRGSWSSFVASWELFKYGAATFVGARRSVAHVRHDVGRRLAAKSALVRPPVVFTGGQALEIARGFARAVGDCQYNLLACSILREHVHMVIARHRKDIHRIVGHLKASATVALRNAGVDAGGTPWSRNCWTAFLDSDADVRRAEGG